MTTGNPHQERFTLNEKCVVVAGASGGIGAAVCRAVAAAGASVFAVGRNEERLRSVVEEIRSAGRQAHMMVADATDSDAVDATVGAVMDWHGGIDVLVNCVGTHRESNAEDLSEDDWNSILDVNLTSAFRLSKAVARQQIGARSGKHIHISSVRSLLGIRRGYAAYCASKGGLNMLIKQLASEWGRHGITVNGVAPTFTRTDLVKDYLEDEAFRTSLVDRIPLGRICEPEDVASVAVFLASPAADYMTGQIIPLDGGITACQ